MIRSYIDFINEEINWEKQPWKFLKNIMKLEEPDIEDEESQETKKPDDIVDMTTTFQISVLRPDSPDRIGDAMELLIKKHHLSGKVIYKGSMKFKLELRGKRKDADAFYKQLKEILK